MTIEAHPDHPAPAAGGDARLVNLAQARRMLVEAQVTDRRARDVLASGLAGELQPIGARSYVSRASVAALAARPWLGANDLDARFPQGWVVWRSPMEVVARESAEQLVDLATCTREVNLWNLVGLKFLLVEAAVPLMATVAGFVYRGAEIVDARLDGTLTLRPPGP